MHVQTHILSGWVIGNYLPIGPRERLFCMIAAGAADLDGISFLFGEEAWWDYHHVLGHNLLAGAVLSVILAAFSTRRVLAFVTYLGLFHLHVLMDLYGSGPGWEIAYLWPFWSRQWSTNDAWAFYSRQNLGTAAVLIAWTVALVFLQRRTPLERLMPSLDRQLVELMTRRKRTV